MKKYKVVEILGMFGIFIDDEVEAKDEQQAKEQVFYEIYDNFGNYIDIKLEEVEE